MSEESVEVDMRLGGALRDFLSIQSKRGTMKILKKARPVVILGRAVTSDAQSADQTTCVAGVRTAEAVRYHAPVDASAAAIDLDGQGIEIGDRFEIFCTAAAGANPDAQVYSTAGMVVMIEYARLNLQNGVGVANRTMQLGLYLNVLRAWALTHPVYSSAISGNVTASQYGGILDAPWGVEEINLNGTITGTAGRSPFPLWTEVTAAAGTLRLTGTIVNVQAADLAAVQMWCRRVA